MPARHELAVLADQESHHTGHIVGTAKPIQGRLLLQFSQLLLAPPIFIARRLNNARVDSINADTEGTEFLSGGESDTAESEFGGAVGNEVGEAAETGDGGADDDGAAAGCGLHGCCCVFDAKESWFWR